MKREPAVYDYAAADISNADLGNWRGYVDLWDPRAGIQGWALAMDSIGGRVKLELVVGETAFATAETGESRPDIDSIVNTRAEAGFCFQARVFDRLAQLDTRRQDLPVNIRIAGTNVVLQPGQSCPTVGELVESWRRSILESLQHSDPGTGKGDRLRARLAVMRAEAEAFRDLALRPVSENEVGQIEAVHVGSDGLIWIIGWVARGSETEFPCIIIDRQKYPGGAANIHYERQDLASGYVGFVGLMDTGWTPPALLKDFFVHIGHRAKRQLRAGSKVRLIGLEEFLGIYKQADQASVAGNADTLAAVLTSNSSWVPGNAQAVGIAAEASLDRLLMVPGFGCIVEGWAVSPAKRVQTFQLKLADCVLIADEASTYFLPRPDLASVFGGGTSVVARAGFVTVLRGALPSTVSGAPLLRVIHDDGTSFVQRLDPRLLHQLDYISDSAEILRFYPSLRHERFYAVLLDAIRRRLADKVRAPVAISAAPCQRVIVLRLPSERSNQRLLFDCIARSGGNPHGIGVCVVADHERGLAEAKLLFEELRPIASMPLSLFCVDDVNDGFNSLPFLLSQILAERFLYVDRGVLLTARGWEQGKVFLAGHGHRIQFGEIVDDAGAPDRIHGSLSAGCFAWTSAALLAWIASAPRFIHGVFKTNGLPKPLTGSQVLTSAATRAEVPRSSRLADMVDEDLLDSYRQGVRASA
jgi:hypothetical protein